MQRCDFVSVISILRDGLIAGNYENAVALIEALFCDYQDLREKYMDRSQVNKWLKGTLKLSDDIVDFYSNDKANERKLSITIQDAFLTVMADEDMTVQAIEDLLVRDSTVSETKKQQLCKLRAEESNANFVTAVLIFAMQRKFVPANRSDVSKGSAVLQDYIIDDGLTKPCAAFCGRDEEIAQLHELLQNNDKVFLQGIPGIGKSELARAYARLYGKTYAGILFLPYTGNLHRDIADLEFVDDRSDDEDELFKRHNRFLRTLREDTLIIVDNFNTTPDREPLLSVMLKYRCKILFTTKSVFDGQKCLELREISDHETLFHLAKTYFPEAEKYRPIVEDILRIVHYHTLSVELAARLLDKGILQPEELLAKLRTEHASFDGTDKITIDKDGQVSRATYYEHLRTLVALFRLGETQCYAMRCMAMIPLSGIHARLFARWADLSDLNAVEELTVLGFIQQREGHILSLHPMIQEVTVADLKPGVNNCHMMLKQIGDFCMLDGQEQQYRKLILRTIGNMSRLLIQDDKEFFLFFLEHTFASLRQPGYEKQLTVLVNAIESVLSDESVGTDVDRAMLFTYKAYFSHKILEVIELYKKAVAVFPAVDSENAFDLYHIHSELADAYRRAGKKDLALKHMAAAYDLMKQYCPQMEIHETGLAVRYAALLNDTGRFRESYDILNALEQKLRKSEPTSLQYAAVLRHLCAAAVNLGNIDEGLRYLQISRDIALSLSEGNDEMQQHYQQLYREIQAVVSAIRSGRGRYIGGVK